MVLIFFFRGLRKWIKRRRWRSRQNSVNETPKQKSATNLEALKKTPTSSNGAAAAATADGGRHHRATSISYDAKSPKTPTSNFDARGSHQRQRKTSTNVVKQDAPLPTTTTPLRSGWLSRSRTPALGPSSPEIRLLEQSKSWKKSCMALGRLSQLKVFH